MKRRKIMNDTDFTNMMKSFENHKLTQEQVYEVSAQCSKQMVCIHKGTSISRGIASKKTGGKDV